MRILLNAIILNEQENNMFRFFTKFSLLLMVLFAPFTAQAQSGKVFDPAEWTKVCDPLPNNPEKVVCILSRDVRDNRGQLIGQTALGFAKGEKPNKLTVLVPLPLAIIPGVAIQIDSNPLIVGKISVCTLQGCFAEVPAGEADLETLMKKGNVLSVHFKSPPPKVEQMTYVVSLKGFTAAFNGEGFTTAQRQEQKKALDDKTKELAEQKRQQLLEKLKENAEQPSN